MAGSGELRGLARGLSEAAFRERYGTEEQCREALFALRWGRGWTCPKCGHGRPATLARRALLQCNKCRHQVSLTAGTIFHATKLPLTTWFQAIYHLSQSKGGISSVELGRRLGIRQPSAWLLKQKLMQAMALREAAKPKLGGRIEVDDAYLGGERSGKRGRGAAGKTPFVAAVETTPEQRPRRLRLTVVKGFRKAEIGALAKASLAAGSHVISDGLSCWPAVAEAGCRHWPMPTGSGRQAARWAPFKWVNTALGNIKTALSGTHHHVSAKHAQRYLASFAWRFNRRHQLATLTERLAFACIHAPPHPYRAIVTG
jgi:transposase-like protein